MKNWLSCILSLIIFMIGIIPQVIFNINYNVDINGHLKRAADASSTDIALKEMNIVISNIENKWNLTEGSSHIFYASPSTDIKFWYENLKSSVNELEKVTPQTQALEKTNILMKLRETLLDHSEGGMSVTQPPNLHVYPYQISWFWFNLICVVSLFITFFYGLSKIGEFYY